jgi:ectoine hydroxylase-related dioxygenase (phytanoyl-CoA dioxygenase family)
VEEQVRGVAEVVALADLVVSASAPALDERLRAGLARYGAMVVTDCYQPDELATARELLIRIEQSATRDDPSFLWQGDAMWAIWNLFEKSAALMRLCLTPRAFTALARAMGEPLAFTRATVMKKQPGAGQQVIGWHQDCATAVDRELGDEASVGIRAGVPHRDVAFDLYKRMVNVRINLEPQYADGGCLQIIPGTHRVKIHARATHALAPTLPILLCPVPAGSILVYQPMLIHSSGPNTRNKPDEHRRVVHTEYRPVNASPGEGCDWYPWRHQAEIHADRVAFWETDGEGAR